MRRRNKSQGLTQATIAVSAAVPILIAILRFLSSFQPSTPTNSQAQHGFKMFFIHQGCGQLILPDQSEVPNFNGTVYCGPLQQFNFHHHHYPPNQYNQFNQYDINNQFNYHNHFNQFNQYETYNQFNQFNQLNQFNSINQFTQSLSTNVFLFSLLARPTSLPKPDREVVREVVYVQSTRVRWKTRPQRKRDRNCDSGTAFTVSVAPGGSKDWACIREAQWW